MALVCAANGWPIVEYGLSITAMKRHGDPFLTLRSPSFNAGSEIQELTGPWNGNGALQEISVWLK